MSDVTLSRAIRSNLLHLQNTASLMDVTQERLATGKKVNSALDNPTNFFTASSLNARSADIGTLLDAMGNGIRTIEAADNGLTAITKAIESMQSTLRQARQDRSFAVRSFELDPTAIGTTTEKFLTLSGGSIGDTAVDIPLNTIDGDPAVQGTVTAPNTSYTAPIAASAGEVSFAFAGPLTFDDGADEITFSIAVDGGGAVPVTIDQGIADSVTGGTGVITTAAQFRAAIEAALAAGPVDDVTVATDGTNITLTSDNPGAVSEIDVTAVGNTGGSAGGLVADGDTGSAAIDRAITINGVAITLTAANAATAEDAADHINSVLAAETPAVAITATGNDVDGTIDLAGPADGSVDITLGGDADAVFGAARVAVPAEASTGPGAVMTVDELVDWINDSALLDDRIRATNDNGKLRIENLSTADLVITGYDTASKTIDGGTGEADLDGNPIRSNLAIEYNQLKTELDRLSEDSSYNGVNLLRGDELKIIFNETGTSSITIQTKDSTGASRPISTGELGLEQISSDDLNFDEQIDALLANLASALSEVRTQSSSLGANLSSVQNREEFTKKMMNTLETGAANLTLADTNEEAANLLALQTRQQLSQTALSLASQADQAVLRLFG